MVAGSVPVERLAGVGARRAQQLKQLGIHTVQDLLFHFPLRYEDRSRLIPLRDLTGGQKGTYWGVVVQVQELRPRPRLTLLKVLLDDGTGQAYALWFNRTYLKNVLLPGTRVVVYGRGEVRRLEKTITVADFEVLEPGEEVAADQGLLPVYPLTRGLSQRFLRQLVRQALDRYAGAIPEILPENIRKFYRLAGKGEALRQVHCPQTLAEAEKGRKTLAYEELLLWQLGLLRDKAGAAEEGIAHAREGPLLKRFMARLPFSLTRAQRRVLAEIFHDMEQPVPMTRLLQGDVGSGKTVVAVLALLKAIDNGYQGALMVPTEILAEQHYLNLKNYVGALGVRMALATSNLTREERERLKQDLAAGHLQLVVGTHALIQEDIEFANLGLAVIDEQHRFGVSQRGQLLAKGKIKPDLLIMTATPIPRTLALTFYGDLDFSVIDELPPGRRPVITRYVPASKREQAYAFIAQQLRQGRQAYVVCPLIDESEKIAAEAASTLYDDLRRGAFRDYRLALLHG
ncbi:MAG TPA: ATP-dependent DNA helicase RecG, partial [Clostridia bacterium]|nr:ATP-dependent DNA helicase RecG [Clostridia bacterium]